MELKENQILIMGDRDRPIYFGRDEDAGCLNLEIRWGIFVPKSEWKHWGIQAFSRLYAKEIKSLDEVTVKSISDFENLDPYSGEVWIAYADLASMYKDQTSRFALDKICDSLGEVVTIMGHKCLAEEKRKMYALLVGKYLDTHAFVRSEDAVIVQDAKFSDVACGKSVLLSVDGYINRFPNKLSVAYRFHEDVIQEKGKKIWANIKAKLTEEEWNYIGGDEKAESINEFHELRKHHIWRKKQ